ncbi:conserved exported hypothetical protein [uncultured Desulfovibrio sp.]|uniref:Acid stress chaperone HdeB n=1 Tax=uncultured Desulfovibrio sp. TaxID=167968 RepID=A0A212JLE4_9BACT|nr:MULTISPECIES: HdeA/HdeB family chaperone [Desulfovibrio]MCB6542901.1 HdeA family protein [Desulfovibrio desulfuricans]MCB6553941.1 HdeA family protein [Desulfovibrio desulfuricans]MCB6565804.1 HdeA family protein [Desulfovibrio desulfuricans]MCB7346985.1 HdeA family protein [Desulfovibrio desulfuricans]MCQ4862198.1 HdeA family protein [Desulfovibrio desulfuricans]
MKKYMLAALTVFMLGTAPFAAHAAEQDVAKITCKDFLADKQNISMMVMWIDGYMSGKSGNTSISDQWMEKLGTHLGTYCAKNPAKTIMDAIEAVPE